MKCKECGSKSLDGYYLCGECFKAVIDCINNLDKDYVEKVAKLRSKYKEERKELIYLVRRRNSTSLKQDGVGQQVVELKNKGKSLQEISRLLEITYDQAYYLYNSRK